MRQGKTRRKFNQAFKLEAVQLSRQPGMTAAKVAADLGVPVGSLHRWRKELADLAGEAFRGNGRRTAEQEELARLRRENAELRMEREILKKATAWFAKHTL
jgi:transposase-like protein